MSLKDALQEHMDRKKKDPLAVMTMILKHSKPSILTHQTRLGNDEIVMAIDPETKELLYYEDRADNSHLYVTIDKDILTNNSTLQLHNDMEVCFETEFNSYIVFSLSVSANIVGLSISCFYFYHLHFLPGRTAILISALQKY